MRAKSRRWGASDECIPALASSSRLASTSSQRKPRCRRCASGSGERLSSILKPETGSATSEVLGAALNDHAERTDKALDLGIEIRYGESGVIEAGDGHS